MLIHVRVLYTSYITLLYSKPGVCRGIHLFSVVFTFGGDSTVAYFVLRMKMLCVGKDTKQNIDNGSLYNLGAGCLKLTISLVQ